MAGARIGTWLKLDTSETVEIAAAAGLDFVIVDCEHALISASTLSAMLAVASGLDLSVYVRVPSRFSSLAGLALDNGADGIVVPNVESVASARAAVAAMRFPPAGSRGLSASARAGRWGMTPPANYMREQERHVRLFMQVESTVALGAAADIAAVPGVAGLLVGPADLWASTPGQDEATMDALLAELEATCRDNSVYLGTAANADPRQAHDLIRRGYRMLTMSSDAVMLRTAAAALSRLELTVPT